MTKHHSWSPRYNLLPGHHIRLTLNTSSDPKPDLLIALLNALVGELISSDFSNITVVHAGRGSTTVELAVEKERAEIAKTRAEINKLRAETRVLDLSFVGSVATVLFAVAVTIGDDVAGVRGSVGKIVQQIASENNASICTIVVGEKSIEIDLIKPAAIKGEIAATAPNLTLGDPQAEGIGQLEPPVEDDES